MDYVSGKFGRDLVQDYIENLVRFPQLRIPELALEFFKLSLEAFSEKWRRFVFVVSSFPFETFKLVDLDHEPFLQKYSELQGRVNKCATCIDSEFTGTLLRYIVSCQDEVDPVGVAVREKVANLQQFLQHITFFAPISSDLVECLHGYCQRLVRQTGGGSRPMDSSAQQQVLWGLITKAYNKTYSFMWDHFGDRFAPSRVSSFGNMGRRCRNQYSTAVAQKGSSKHQKANLSFAKLDRMVAFGQRFRKPRRLCGS